MGRTITVNGQGYTSHWRQYESSWTQKGFLGEYATSSLVFDDDNNDIDHDDFASLKIIEIWDDASGSSVMLYRGRVLNKTLTRGDKVTGNAMRWVVTAADYNWDLRWLRVTDSVRPEESDRERVLAYMTAYLNGAASTNAHARDTTELDGTYVVNADLITLPAETYVDTYPVEVFSRISELSAKNFFVFPDDAGQGQLYYASFTDTTFASTISITDVLGDADGVDSYHAFLESVSGEHEGERVITGGGVRFGTDQFYELSDIASSEADHDKAEEHFQDDYLNTEGDADKFITNMVASRNNENFSFIVTIKMDDENAHRIRAGMTLSYRMAATDVQTPVTYRAVQVEHKPYGPGITDVTIELGWPRGRPFRRHIRTKPGPFPPTPTEPGTPATPDTTVAAWHFDTGVVGNTQLDDSSTYPVSGKWNTAAYAYSTNLLTQVATHSKSPKPAATAGTTYRISGRMRNRDLVRNPNGLSLIMGFKTGAGTTIPTPVNVGNTGATENVWVSVSGTAVAPATTASVVWGVSSTAAGTDFTVAGSLADVDDVVISEVGTGTPAVPGSGGINPDLIGDDTGQYALADHTHLTVSATDDPTVNDDDSEGFIAGTWWFNESNGKLFLSLDSTTGAAVWLEVLNENYTHSHDAEDITGLDTSSGGATVVDLSPAPDSGWNALGKPNAAYYNGITYWGYVAGDSGDVAIRSYNHLTGEISAETVLKAALDADDHASPTVLVRDSDKKILVAYSAHNGTALYTRLSSNPEDISSFAAEVNQDASLGGTNYTYPSLIQLTGETNDPIYLFVRRVSGGASQTWGYATSTDQGVTWSALTTFFSVSGRWAYVTMVPNGDDRIDFFAQDGSAGAGDATVSVYHFYLTGGAWFESDGTSAGSLPLDETDLTVVHSGASGGSKHVASIAIGTDGNPVVAYKNFTGTTTADYRWGRWTGSAWSTAAVAGDGYFAVNYQSGDLTLDSKRPTVVYASRDVDGTMQMFRYHTRDRGTTWSEEQLTEGTDDAIFPTSPFNRGAALPVLWMLGTWTGATTYDMGTSGLVGEQAEPEGGASAGVTDHGALTGLSDDDHTQYTQKATLTTTGDIYYASSASTPARRGIGSEGDVLTVVSGVPGWATPSAAAGLIPVDTGTVAYDTSTPGEVGITVTSDWGVDTGVAYYDDTGAAAGEEAALFWDPATGQYTVVPYEF